MPHTSYTHEVIQLTDGRCYCLSCDEVVDAEYLPGSEETAVDRSPEPGPSPRAAEGD